MKKIKKYIIPLIFIFFTITLILFSKSNIIAVKSGLNLWINNIVPSLFSFFIAVELLNNTFLPKLIGKWFQKIMRPFFNVPGIGAYALFMGIISGYPVGAKIVTDLRNKNLCTKEEGERLITFTNNSGPLFILGTVGITMFGDSSIGILLLITHLLSCFTVAFVFRFWKYKNRNENAEYLNNSSDIIYIKNLGRILSTSIINAIKSVVLIGGFVVLFSVIISIFNKIYIFKMFFDIFKPAFIALNINPNFIVPIISGLIELTSGVSLVASVPSASLGINVIFASFLLGFGGISILLQVWGISSNSDISIKPYILGKLLQGIFASFYTFLIITYFPLLKYLLV